MTVLLGRRIAALEQRLQVDRGVVGFCTPRGGSLTPDEAERLEQQIAELHGVGYGVVYVARLAGRSTAEEAVKQGECMP